MAYTGSGSGEAKVPGARRRKLAGYLSELRQNVFQGAESHPWGHDAKDEGHNAAFPDASVVRSGHEEMMLFPSYARKHVRIKPSNLPQAGDGNDADYWQREWTRHESDKGVTVVDVRGWIYTPHRGPATRRQRLMIGLARQLSGIPAPPPSGQPTDGRQTSSRSSSPVRMTSQEEDLIALEAENIVQLGNSEAEAARRGAFSETPRAAGNPHGLDGTQSRKSSPERQSRAQKPSGIGSNASDASEYIAPLKKRESWSDPSRMSAAELGIANSHLLKRLKPFMSTPLAEGPVVAFFYNDETSRQRTVFTDTSGHFSCRATLDFVPTHVRVVAGDNLSATEEVAITEPHGVSLISDIDDTIKHSAISAGAREIFRNAFIRDLDTLTIDGVRPWYNRLHDMGVKLHYVSNSPWQMYPILTTFFKVAGLPRGSFHLKQYTGMLQGIFEPVAERKKSSLDKLLRDFPDRRFILVGDSGEADLEVYTDLVMDNPGRILGVFIRDVTSTVKTGYFDPSGVSGRGSRQHSRAGSGEGLEMSKRISRPVDVRDDDADLRDAIAASLADMEAETQRAKRSVMSDSPSDDQAAKPALPPRNRGSQTAHRTASPDEDLIDLSEDTNVSQTWLSASPSGGKPPDRNLGGSSDLQRSTDSPPPPPKPSSLRGPSPNTLAEASGGNGPKQPPPRPRKPSSAVKPPTPDGVRKSKSQGALQALSSESRPSPLSQVQRQTSTKERPPLPARKSYVGLAKDRITSVVSSAGSWHDTLPSLPPRPTQSHTVEAPRPRAAISPILQAQRPADAGSVSERPLGSPRRIGSSGSFAALRMNSNRQSGAWSDDGLPGSPGEAGMSKKEFLWLQRLQRARSVLDRQGVTLRTWRVGSDAQGVCVKLVEMALKEMGVGNKNSR